jgi:hypothetical protein
LKSPCIPGFPAISAKHQFLEILRIVVEFHPRHGSDVFGAGAEGRIEELASAGIVPEMLGVLGGKKGALVMIEPPGEARVRRILEIDNRVDVAVEHARFEQLRGFVRQAGIAEIGVRVKLFLYKTAEEGRRSGAVEAMIVIENPHPHVYVEYQPWKTC